MRNSSLSIVFSGLVFLLSGTYAFSQSQDLNFPTPVFSGDIAGTIQPRPMGDGRVTSYYYTFEGGQGDIFINVVSQNFNGDIDVYMADSMQPVTKIVLYADAHPETGRVIYLRRPAKLILRVQGRTPNDEPANFRIKFAGSFIASREQEPEDAPAVARSIEPEREREAKEDVTTPTTQRSESSGRIITSEVPTVFGNRPGRTRSTEREGTSTTSRSAASAKKEDPQAVNEIPLAVPAKRDTVSKTADPLESIRLVIETKDGGVIEHPMSNVVRFSVDKGVLTLVVKNGKINRFSILNVERVTIQ